MTATEFKIYKVNLEKDYSDLIYVISKKIKIGKTIGVPMQNLILMSFYIEMILNYNLPLETEDNMNYLSDIEMQDIAFNLNRLLNKVYNPDFILTE